MHSATLASHLPAKPGDRDTEARTLPQQQVVGRDVRKGGIRDCARAIRDRGGCNRRRRRAGGLLSGLKIPNQENQNENLEDQERTTGEHSDFHKCSGAALCRRRVLCTKAAKQSRKG